MSFDTKCRTVDSEVFERVVAISESIKLAERKIFWRAEIPFLFLIVAFNIYIGKAVDTAHLWGYPFVFVASLLGLNIWRSAIQRKVQERVLRDFRVECPKCGAIPQGPPESELYDWISSKRCQKCGISLEKAVDQIRPDQEDALEHDRN